MEATTETTPRRRKGGHGRRPLPAGEALVGYGMHFRPASLRDLREAVAFRGGSAREIMENQIARVAARMRSDPLYREWVEAGRPVPVADWIAAGKPDDWEKFATVD